MNENQIKNRRGIIEVSRQFFEIDYGQETLHLLFQSVLPIRAEYLFDRDTVRFTIISYLLPIVDKGAVTPKYRVIFTKDEKTDNITFRFEDYNV